MLALVAGFKGAWFAVADDPVPTPLIICSTLTFFAASVSHAVILRTLRRTLALLAVAAGGSLLVESIGVQFGVPFGAYAYTDRLGWKLFNVPLIVPLAWTMMAYPAFLVGRRITNHPVRGPLVAAIALVAWDLLLDPLMVEAGCWTWRASGSAWLGIPFSNFLGWLWTATGTMFLLWPCFPEQRSDSDLANDSVPYGLYVGTYVCLLLRAVLHDIHIALVGGLGMGVVVCVFAMRDGSRSLAQVASGLRPGGTIAALAAKYRATVR